jgi:hypothetical protein
MRNCDHLRTLTADILAQIFMKHEDQLQFRSDPNEATLSKYIKHIREEYQAGVINIQGSGAVHFNWRSFLRLWAY